MVRTIYVHWIAWYNGANHIVSRTIILDTVDCRMYGIGPSLFSLQQKSLSPPI